MGEEDIKICDTAHEPHGVRGFPIGG